MDECGEVEAYSSAAAQSYLSKIDDTFVAHARRLVSARIAAGVAGTGLDIGTGPGQIAPQTGCATSRLAVRRRGSLAEHDSPGACGAPSRASRIKTAAPRSCGCRGGLPRRRRQSPAVPRRELRSGDLQFRACTISKIRRGCSRKSRASLSLTRAILLRDLRRPSRIAYPLPRALVRPALLGDDVPPVLRFAARRVHLR